MAGVSCEAENARHSCTVPKVSLSVKMESKAGGFGIFLFLFSLFFNPQQFTSIELNPEGGRERKKGAAVDWGGGVCGVLIYFIARKVMCVCFQLSQFTGRC